MSQDIAAIIARPSVDIPKEVIHFREGGTFIIVLDIFLDAIGYFVKESTKFQHLSEFLNHLKVEKQTDDASEHWSPRGSREDSLEILVDLIEKLELTSFIVEYYSDWADMPTDCYRVAIVEGNIVHGFTRLEGSATTEKVSSEQLLFIQNKLLYNPSWYGNEERYKYYDSAVRHYQKLQSEGN